MPKLALVGPPGGSPPRSPARAKLAELIAEKAGRDAHRESVTSAYRAAEQGLATARSRLEDAREAVETAKNRAAEYLTAQAMGRAVKAPATVKAARDAERDAEDDLDIAQATLDRLNQEMVQAQSSGLFRDDDVRQAALAVLVEETDPEAALERVERACRELLAAGHLLRWMVEEHFFPGVTAGTRNWDPTTLGGRAKTALGRLYSPPDSWGALQKDRAVGADRLRLAGALDALMQDADAPIPTVGA